MNSQGLKSGNAIWVKNAAKRRAIASSSPRSSRRC